uniref:Uncharacterized protein n=1 Tax=Oryza sativa subsp. japonica TaxID=39947 RepID=Q6YSX8_ORYSJ|nr:hypothetical protein [Oryza sativa Japonica Group]BAC84762.1 hypothetical protein [Oryza sativa Japonica Group]
MPLPTAVVHDNVMLSCGRPLLHHPRWGGINAGRSRLLGEQGNAQRVERRRLRAQLGKRRQLRGWVSGGDWAGGASGGNGWASGGSCGGSGGGSASGGDSGGG